MITDPHPRRTIAFAVALAVFGGAAWLYNSLNAPAPVEPPTSADARLTSAVNACEEFVRRSLHDRDSATFELPVASEVGPDEYMVKATVRAKNGFNAVRAAETTCTATYEQPKDLWHLKSITP